MNLAKTAALLAGLTALFVLAGGLLGGVPGMVIAFAVAAGMNFMAWWNSEKLALRVHGARLVDRRTAPDLFRIVEVLSMNAGMPTPSVYVIESEQPNAFATGRSPDNSAVAVTTGLMRRLSRDELAGVIAHELAHIKNRDTLIMTVAATVAGALSMLAQFGLLFGAGRDRGGVAIIGAILAAILAPIAAMLIQMAISRTREYSADRMGAEICGNPLWLAGALRAISRERPEMPSAEANPATAHLFIVNPLSGHRFDGLFATHPPITKRISELEAMARDMRSGPIPAPRAETPAPGRRRGAGVPIVRSRPDRKSGPWR